MARVSWGCHLGHSGLNDWTDLSIYWTTQHICFIVIFACSCSIESRLDLDSTVHDIIWLYILSILLLPIISQSNWSCHDTALARTGVINATQVWNQGLYNSPSLTLSFPLKVSIVHLLCIFFHRIQDSAIAFIFFHMFSFSKKSSFRIFPWFLLCQISASAARSFRSVASASSRAACSIKSSSRSCNAQFTSRSFKYQIYQ